MAPRGDRVEAGRGRHYLTDGEVAAAWLIDRPSTRE